MAVRVLSDHYHAGVSEDLYDYHDADHRVNQPRQPLGYLIEQKLSGLARGIR